MSSNFTKVFLTGCSTTGAPRLKPAGRCYRQQLDSQRVVFVHPQRAVNQIAYGEAELCDRNTYIARAKDFSSKV